jgi:hypothetical protein
MLRLLLASSLLLTATSAQHRLYDPSDKVGRLATASDLEQALSARHDLHTTVALAAVAGQTLPEGSGARAQLTEALRQANLADHDPATASKAERRLRMALGDLCETLLFEPRREAELPVGFPDFQAVGELELRQYPAYRMVRAEMKRGSMGAFWPLFRHIESNGIAMTSPVQMDWTSSELAPTAKPAQMAFLYGNPSITPKTTEPGVEVVEVAAMTAISIGAIGDDRRDAIEAMQERIQQFLAMHGAEWEIAGSWRTMGYNSPMVPRDRRYFEVQLPVRRRQP